MLAASRGAGPQRVLELGAGTGIATRMLLQEAHRFGGIARYIAFDIADGMLRHLRGVMLGTGAPGLVQQLRERGLLAQDAEFAVERGAFDSFDAPGLHDLVAIAQAWHWCPDYDRALARIAAALRPGGVLALLWNLEDRGAAAWVAHVRDAYEPYEDGAPQYRHMAWKAMYDTPAFRTHFEPLEEVRIARVLPTTKEGVLQRVSSKSYISVLDEATRSALLARIGKMLDGEDAALERRWIDHGAGVWEYPYQSGTWH